MTKKHTDTTPEAQPDYQDLYLRVAAEQDNSRKRFEQEKQNLAKFAKADAALSLLPVLDNFYRATEHVPEDQKGSAWLTGILHIQKQLQDVLGEWQVEEIQVATGDKFDPSLHESMAAEPNDQIPEDHIVSVLNRGYRLHGRVLRPALVVTSQNK